MNSGQKALDRIAALFEYPNTDYFQLLDEAVALCTDNKDASEQLQEFKNAIGQNNATELEELYTRTFDINPVASLELGWHIYGEQYERGAFLVQMRARLRELGINEGTELPDHITSTLRLLAAVDEEEGKAFTARYLRPAMRKILEGLESKKNPYRFLVQAVNALTEMNSETKEGVEQHV